VRRVQQQQQQETKEETLYKNLPQNHKNNITFDDQEVPIKENN